MSKKLVRVGANGGARISRRYLCLLGFYQNLYTVFVNSLSIFPLARMAARAFPGGT